jgi:hypothetical protein
MGTAIHRYIVDPALVTDFTTGGDTVVDVLRALRSYVPYDRRHSFNNANLLHMGRRRTDEFQSSEYIGEFIVHSEEQDADVIHGALVSKLLTHPETAANLAALADLNGIVRRERITHASAHGVARSLSLDSLHRFSRRLQDYAEHTKAAKDLDVNYAVLTATSAARHPHNWRNEHLMQVNIAGDAKTVYCIEPVLHWLAKETGTSMGAVAYQPRLVSATR